MVQLNAQVLMQALGSQGLEVLALRGQIVTLEAQVTLLQRRLQALSAQASTNGQTGVPGSAVPEVAAPLPEGPV
jgi:hypothetical protein